MTPVRSKRGRYVHATNDLRRTICSKPCDAWICETAEWKDLCKTDEACPTCVEMTTTN
jgi:hypothetical protein